MGATHFVIDLRNNPGGLLDAGIDTARLFLVDGTILFQKYKNQPEIASDIKIPGPYVDLPLAVIVNNGTASAAEVLAGALQAHQRARVYGQPTYGKDTLQLVFELSDHSSLHVTAARWWVPGLVPPVADNGVIPETITSTDPSEIKPEIQAILKDFSINS
jgi:carboxyl-terminal processing protease